MNILSLFDGMSCGRIALQRAGIPVTSYFASELDKHAITVSRSNWKDIIQIGDVNRVSYNNGILFTEHGEFTVDIDMVIGGSPCQSFSSLGNGLGFSGSSGLFFQYLRILKEVSPRYFLLENVTMKQQWQDYISKLLGVEPVYINSNLVSAQNRARLYWSNINIDSLPINKNIKLKDILEPRSFQFEPASIQLLNKHRLAYILGDKAPCLTTHSSNANGIGRVFLLKDSHKPFKVKPFDYSRIDMLTRNEVERLQTVPENYTNSVSYSHACKMLGNGWTVDAITHIFGKIQTTPNPIMTYNNKLVELDF